MLVPMGQFFSIFHQRFFCGFVPREYIRFIYVLLLKRAGTKNPKKTLTAFFWSTMCICICIYMCLCLYICMCFLYLHQLCIDFYSLFSTLWSISSTLLGVFEVPSIMYAFLHIDVKVSAKRVRLPGSR